MDESPRIPSSIPIHILLSSNRTERHRLIVHTCDCARIIHKRQDTITRTTTDNTLPIHTYHTKISHTHALQRSLDSRRTAGQYMSSGVTHLRTCTHSETPRSCIISSLRLMSAAIKRTQITTYHTHIISTTISHTLRQIACQYRKVISKHIDDLRVRTRRQTDAPSRIPSSILTHI